MKEQTFIRVLSTLPAPVTAITTTRNEIMNRKVTGITEVLISSSLEAVEPMAPYRKAYSKNPSTKNTSR